jgi:FkbM family methyltransferase
MDILGQLIKKTPEFPGKASRLVPFWMSNRDQRSIRQRALSSSIKISCDLSVPYEAMVWLEREEEDDLAITRKLLKPGDIFVDCGANIGLWSLVAASVVGTTGKVFAFEPNPLTFRKLVNNLQCNHNAVISAYNMALGNKEGVVNFLCYEEHNISRFAKQEELANSTEVEIGSLDQRLLGQAIDGMKIDVEGLELDVLRGAERLLKSNYPWICVEFNTLISQVNTLSEWPVHNYLKSFGYQCYQFKFRSSKGIYSSELIDDNYQTIGYRNLFYLKK